MPITFTKVKLEYGWLSNMSPHRLIYKGKEWKTAEALFQSLRFDNEEIIEAIRTQKSPFSAKLVAKARGNANGYITQPRSAEDVENMIMCVRLKTQQHPEIVRQLKQTGNERIIEDATNRQSESSLFWGAALNAEGNWVGENKLGEIWMKIREEL